VTFIVFSVIQAAILLRNRDDVTFFADLANRHARAGRRRRRIGSARRGCGPDHRWRPQRSMTEALRHRPRSWCTGRPRADPLLLSVQFHRCWGLPGGEA
jgi:hypothetical protein